MNRWMMTGFALAALLFIVGNATFIVGQTQQVLVVRFGDIKRVEQTPGLKFKVPFMDALEYYDNRLLDFNTPPQEFITKDRRTNVEERVVIDSFVRYRITDPVKFYQAVRSEANLQSRMSGIVIANMRKIIARNSLSDLLSEKRAQIMREILAAVNRQSTSEEEVTAASENDADADAGEDKKTPPTRRRSGFGIEVVDLRIMRADLPEDISQSTFERMRKNFTKEAQKFRAEGEEKALEVRSNADRERTGILAEAQKQAEIIRGEGDGKAAEIYAKAFGRDPEFYAFYRSMQAYRKALKNDDTTLILSPKSEFLNQME